jgi:hypothetical protein
MIKYNKIPKIAIHLFIWSILLLFPFLISPEKENDFSKLISYNGIFLLQCAIIFYLNYFIFSNQYFFQKKYVFFLLINCCIILIILCINWQLRNFFMKVDLHAFQPPNMQNNMNRLSMPFNKMHPPLDNFFIFKDLFSFFVPVIFSIAVRATENWIKTEAEKKEIVNRNLESELQHLRYQLQPHFFFNSLNNIYSLIETSPANAQQAVHNLGKLMRYLLYDTRQEKVELSQEISFLEKYIQIMELRHTDKTLINYMFPETGNASYSIAPLLFIPLIENAYKHGISATRKSFISFEIKINGNQLHFTSENSNFPKNITDKSGSGIGLVNLKKRLDLIYKNKYELLYEVRKNVFYVSLKIEINKNV